MPTLGSLFDGIGGFPLVAVRHGITPVWASEIEAFPISVTKHHFPDMLHVGDITQLNGATLPPVDVITGGSPCQDLSVAGARRGLAGERSGLFMEQIRIIKEMRCEDERQGRTDHNIRPRYAAWENVPGAFSSGQPKGEDFRIVLEEFARIADDGVSVPRPPGGVWKSAGCILGEQFSVAWRVYDTQYWPGTPQRRRRIYLVADFGGHRAPKILFEQHRLPRNPPPCGSQGQGTAAPTQGSTADAGTNAIAFATNQRDEVRDLHDVAGAVQAQPGMKQQTFVAQPVSDKEPFAFHINQREETIDLGGVSGALLATNNMQMQTFIAQPTVTPINTQIVTRHKKLGKGTGLGIGTEGDAAYTLQEAHSHGVFINGCLTPWDTQQARISVPEGIAPTLAGADGAGGRNPAGLIISAGFYAGAAPSAGGIGYQPECAPTLKAADSGTNMVPAILCLNDQGGKVMEVSENISGTLRSQEHGHQPLVLATQQGGAEIGVGICPTITSAAGTSGNNQPVLFENHAKDCRYNGPLDVAPTMSASYGTGGNNVPLVAQDGEAICIAGNIIDRQPQNGGNGLGYQPDICYTITATDKHSVFLNRHGAFAQDDIASTQCARQYKDATDLVCSATIFGQQSYSSFAEGASTICASGGTNGGGGENLVAETNSLIRRLTPLECERLQGFPDFWTDIPADSRRSGSSDSARYKALGNSVAIPCVEHVLRGISYFLKEGAGDE